jgi:uncharacterized protein YcaQ
MRYFVRDMRVDWQRRSVWFGTVKQKDLRNVMARIRKQGPLTIRDIDDDVLVEKEHAWGSRKPSKRALQLAFYKGLVTVSQRTGMLKTYELMNRHFGWQKLPRAATDRETLNYLLERALRSQGIVSVESACYLYASRKPAMRRLIEERVRHNELLPVDFPGAGKQQHWVRPATLETQRIADATGLVHILSPFDPLVSQRKRLQLFFDYEHRFEAYLPRQKRVFGYFACPVLVGEQIVAALDLKTDRGQRKLLIQKWTWLARGARRELKARIETALQRFEAFQLA